MTNWTLADMALIFGVLLAPIAFVRIWGFFKRMAR